MEFMSGTDSEMLRIYHYNFLIAFYLASQLEPFLLYSFFLLHNGLKAKDMLQNLNFNLFPDNMLCCSVLW